MSSVLCFGEVLWDVFPDGKRLGGAPLNVAYHLQQLGTSAIMVSCVGEDALGAEALTEIRRAGVDSSAVVRSTSLATGEARVSLDSSGHARFELLSPVAWDEIPRPELLSRPDGILFGTLALRSAHNRDVLSALLDAFPVAWVACDLNLRPPFDVLAPLESFFRRAHLLKVNDTEATQLVGSAPSVGEQAARLQSRFGAPHVCITCGKDGAWLLAQDQVFHAPSPPTTVVDTVGAGDAFTAGLLSGLQRGWPQPDWPRCLRLATALGSYVAGSAGAQPSHVHFRRPDWTATTD